MDKKSKPSIRAAITAIASCFPNVLMVSQPVDVVYASWSRVQADLNCMADLYRSSTQWKYLINLCGQDFPLKTNLEMVRMLSSLKGRNSLESVELRDSNKWRVKKIHQIVNGAIQVRHLSSLCPDYCQTGVNTPVIMIFLTVLDHRKGQGAASIQPAHSGRKCLYCGQPRLHPQRFE